MGEGGGGFAAEAVLEVAHVGVEEAGDEPLGSGDGLDFEVDGVGGLVPVEEEAFLAGAGVVGEGGVGEAEAGQGTGLVEDGGDAAGVEPPEAEEVGEDGEDLAFVGRGVGWPGFDPTEAELVPAFEGGAGAEEGLGAVAEEGAGLVDDVAGWGGVGVEVGGRVGWVQAGLVGEELLDLVGGGPLDRDHGWCWGGSGVDWGSGGRWWYGRRWGGVGPRSRRWRGARRW